MIHCPRFLRFHRAEKWNPTNLNETSWSSANHTVGRRWRTAGRCRWNHHTPTATTQIKGPPDRTLKTSNILGSHQKPETKDMNPDCVMLYKVNRKQKFLTLLKIMAVLYRTLLLGSTSKPPDTLRSKNWVQFTWEIHTRTDVQLWEAEEDWDLMKTNSPQSEWASKEAGGTAPIIYSIQTGHANLKWTERPTLRVEEEVLVWTRSSVGAPWLQNR